MSETKTDQCLQFMHVHGYGSTELRAALAAALAEKDAEIERLKDVLMEAQAVCLCGCSLDRHDLHDPDGVMCEDGDHECELVSATAKSLVDTAVGQAERSAYTRGEAAGLREGFIAGKQARWLAPGWAGRRWGRYDFSGVYDDAGVYTVPLSEELIAAFLTQRTEAKPCAGCGSEGDACAKWRNDGKICCPDCGHCKVTRTEAPR